MSSMPSDGHSFLKQIGEDVAGYSWKSVAQSPLGIYTKEKGVENDAR